MKRRIVGVAALALGASAALMSCGPKKDGNTPQGRGRVEEEFNRCLEQEKYGEAKGCWASFVERFGDVASSAEITLAKEHLERGGATGPAPAPAPGNDAVAQAARRGDQGLIPLGDTGGGSSAPPAGGFPPQRVGWKDCYQGFQVTGNPQQDVAGLGQRCGGPCGMIEFSDIQSDQQAESDNVDVYGVTLRADRCYRFFAVGGSGIDDLDSAIADAEGNIIMRDTFRDPAPILGPEEPFCPPSDGRYKFVVSVAKGSGTFSFQVWQGPKR